MSKERLQPCCDDGNASLVAFAEKLVEVAAIPGGDGTISLNMGDAGKLARAFLASNAASADTHPTGGDAKRAPASLSGAVPAGQTPKPSRGTDHG